MFSARVRCPCRKPLSNNSGQPSAPASIMIFGIDSVLPGELYFPATVVDTLAA